MIVGVKMNRHDDTIETLMDSIHLRMDTIRLDCTCDVLRLESPFTKVDKAIEHPKGIVISSNIETFLMESVNSRVVTVIPKEDIRDKKDRRKIQEIKIGDMKVEKTSLMLNV